jgi:hypothetical protein
MCIRVSIFVKGFLDNESFHYSRPILPVAASAMRQKRAERHCCDSSTKLVLAQPQQAAPAYMIRHNHTLLLKHSYENYNTFMFAHCS